MNLKATLEVNIKFKGVGHYEFIDLFLEPGYVKASAPANHPENMRFIGSDIQDQYQTLQKSESSERKALALLSDKLQKEKDPNKENLIQKKCNLILSRNI